MKYACLAILLATFMLNPVTAVAQTCSATVTSTTSNSRYFDNDDGTVTDAVTGLIWMRCSYGQNWNGTTCTGTAISYQWRSALEIGVLIGTYAGKSDWRLPNYKELNSIVERQCNIPSINIIIFPATPSSCFWSGSPLSDSSSSAWLVDFSDGSSNIGGMGSSYCSVRLVRGGQ